MWFDNYVTVWKQKREHFNSLPLDEFKKGNFFTKDEIKKSCTTYLQEVLSLEFLPTFCPSNEVAKKKSLEKKALLTSPQQSLAFDSLPQHILSSLPEHILSHGVILNRQKNEGNEVFLDDGVIPTTGETVSMNEMKGLHISKAIVYKNLDLDSRSGVDYIFEKKTKKEELVVAYERMLNKILIMNPGTLPEIRINLLKNLDDRTTFLFRAQEEKREDALHPFFSKLELSSDDTAYLRESLENATIDFEEMRKQDSRFDKLISLISLLKGNIHCQYQNLWNKKIAGWMRTDEEYNQIIDAIVSTLDKNDRELISERIVRYPFNDDIKKKFKNI